MSTLQDKIKKFQDYFLPKIPEDVLATIYAETEKLKETKISKNALQVGDIVKDFILPNALSRNVSLYKALENNDFIVLNFYRGIWCPYCNLELQALKGINIELNSLGANIIAISPEIPDLSLSMKQKHTLEFEVLSDAEYKVEKEFGLVFSLAEKLRPIYEEWGFDIPNSNLVNSYDLPMPATYVINKNKEIIFAFIDEDYTKRCEPQEIIDAIKNNKEIKCQD